MNFEKMGHLDLHVHVHVVFKVAQSLWWNGMCTIKWEIFDLAPPNLVWLLAWYLEKYLTHCSWLNKFGVKVNQCVTEVTSVTGDLDLISRSWGNFKVTDHFGENSFCLLSLDIFDLASPNLICRCTDLALIFNITRVISKSPWSRFLGSQSLLVKVVYATCKYLENYWTYIALISKPSMLLHHH